MGMSKHALLSASASHRWLNCPPSALACASIEERASPYAQQGTDAHSLCEYKVGKALGKELRNPAKKLENFDAEMDNCTDEYRNYVLEQLSQAKKFCPDPLVLIEEHLDFSRWVPDGFGTGDCVIVSDSVLHVIDFKYGVGVLVDAEDNPQMMCYALGALDTYDGIYDIETVKMTIFQPRRDNISIAEMSKDNLLAWAKNTLAPTAKQAYEGGGEFKVGDHCRFCKVKATCRKRAEYNLEMAKYDFAMPDTLEPTEIAAILPKIDGLISWGSDIKDYALQQALNGVKYDGFKVVAGRSNRRFTDETVVASTVQSAGYEPYEKKLLGITAMSSMLGKKRFNELLGGLVTKPPGQPVLVPEKDKRPAINTAINDFKEK